MQREPPEQPGSPAAPRLETIEIDAPDRAALFVAVAQAFLAAVAAPEEVQARETRVLERSADSLSDLLETWIAELLLIFSAEKVLLGRARVIVNVIDGGLRLQATLWGEPCDPERHRVRAEPASVAIELIRTAPTFGVRLRLDWPNGGGA